MTPKEEFDLLWKLWPRQIKKTEARKTYEKMRSNGVLPPFEELQLAAERYAAYVSGKIKKHILYLSSWLEGERFEDDLEVDIYKPQVDEQGRTLAEKVRDWLRKDQYGNAETKHNSDRSHHTSSRGQALGDCDYDGTDTVDQDSGSEGGG